jgi:hypothetical protein
MMPNHNQDVLDSIVVRSTEDLFAAYDVKVSRQDDISVPAQEVAYAGVIGFTGGMRGTLVLAPTRALLERSHHGAPCEFRDWAGELANQLLGRINNQLRAYGLELHVTTPVIIKGQYLASVSQGELPIHCFAASPGNVSVWLDAELAANADLTTRSAAPGPVEGEAIIF